MYSQIFSVIFLIGYVAAQDPVNPCLEFAVGNCSISEEFMLWESPQIQDPEICQFACESFQHCLLFRQTEELGCQLTTHDFRESCELVSAPTDGNLQQCLTSNLNGCNGYIDEDCTYEGQSLGLDPPSGEIRSPAECEKLCKGFQVLGCNYWVYNTIEMSCQLLDSAARSCKGLSGPGYPSLAECRPAVPTTSPPAITPPPTM